MPDLEFPTGAGTAPGYLAVPAGEHGPAVIVLQEWWGLDSHIRSVCDRLAAEGFFALAPDLFRGETTTQPSEAEQKLMALSMDQAEHGHVRSGRIPLLARGRRGIGRRRARLLPRRRTVAVGRRRVPADHGGRQLLLRHAPRQARLHRHQRSRPRTLRHRRRVHRTRRSTGARVRADERRRRCHLPLLRRRRTCLLQRRRPPGDLRSRTPPRPRGSAA